MNTLSGTLVRLEADEAGTIDRISKKNSDPTIRPSGRFLVYSDPTDVSDEMLMFNIITTNRNRIAMAPTYTIRYEIPTNPTPSSNRYPAALMKTEIRNSTEITGFFDVITSTPERTAPKANRSSRKLFMMKIYKWATFHRYLKNACPAM